MVIGDDVHLFEAGSQVQDALLGFHNSARLVRKAQHSGGAVGKHGDVHLQHVLGGWLFAAAKSHCLPKLKCPAGMSVLEFLH